MKFEWDDEKNKINKINIRKHRVDFADVVQVFTGPIYISYDTRRDYGEDRAVAIGLLHGNAVVVVYVERNKDTIRIISARKATRNERHTFENEIKD